MTGTVLLVSALCLLYVSLVLYILASMKENRRDTCRVPRVLYLSSAPAILASILYLWQLILSDRFEYAYVVQHSSRMLPTAYKIASLWTGMEGSLFLWLMMFSLTGVLFGMQLKRTNEEAPAMCVLLVIQISLLVLLLRLDPFRPADIPPHDGMGMNPVLQDPWMVVHPPVVFLGYSAIAAPMCLASAALFRREYDHWASRALPWALTAWTCLSFAIFAGSVWAYKVPGWGGYWHWDPVETSSLVVWLAMAALVHGLSARARTGAPSVLNLALAIYSFILIIFTTYITRSGVAARSSSHSYGVSGTAGHFAGLAVIIIAAGGCLLALRHREIRGKKNNGGIPAGGDERYRASEVLAALTVPLLAGVSLPLTGLHIAVGRGFYDSVGLAAAVLLSLLLLYRNRRGLPWRHMVRIGIALILIATPAFFAASQFKWTSRIVWGLLPLSIFILTVYSEIRALLLAGKAGILPLGAPVAHMGAEILLIGVMASSLSLVWTGFGLTVAGIGIAAFRRATEAAAKAEEKERSKGQAVEQDSFTTI